MKPSQLIAFIQGEFDSGKKLVEIESENPTNLRKRLYKLTRVRGLDWGFATLSHSVFVYAMV
jgi:hypothetical protein